MHAKLYEQSEFEVHSGRQAGGEPTYSGKHEHDGLPFTSWHCELGPHGEGTQTLTGSWYSGTTVSFRSIFVFNGFWAE